MGWKDWIGRKIFVELDSNRVYSGVVQESEYLGKNGSDVDIYMISIIDKFGKFVSFKNTEIKQIREES